MYSQNSVMNTILTVLFFPLLFQDMFFNFVIGNIYDPLPIIILKWIFLLIPCLAFLGACWITVFSIITLIFRCERLSFVVALILTWLDFLKSIGYYIGGILKGIFTLVLTITNFLIVIGRSIFIFILDILFIPGRLIRAAGRGVTGASVPWIAVTMTMLAAILESLIFTPIMTPVVIDILPIFVPNIVLQIILFIIIFTLVLASYAVLTITLDTVKKKKVGDAIMIAIIEIVVITVEVMFLYREFVDALVPWFSQYEENFQLGALGTILIAFVAWVGVRSLVWFLFASHGAPIIMDIIQGKPLPSNKETKSQEKLLLFKNSVDFFSTLKDNGVWIQNKGNELIDVIFLPYLQVIAALLNMATLLLVSRHMFDLPFKTLSDIKITQELSSIVKKHKPKQE